MQYQTDQPIDGATYEPRIVSITTYAGVEIHHEFGNRGDHRLHISKRWSDWYIYSDVALLNHEGITYAATSEYWDTELPEVFTIEMIKPHKYSMPHWNSDDHDPPVSFTQKEVIAQHNQEVEDIVGIIRDE